MEAFIEHPLIHSLLGKLRDNFGENGRLELKAEVTAAQLKIKPENICIGFQRLGWTATHETAGSMIVFRFSQPPENFLVCTPQHVAATTQLMARIQRFLKDREAGSTCSYPLKGAIPFRVADLAAKLLRSSGLEVTLLGDSSSRLTELLITLPSQPARIESPKLTE